MTSVIGFYFISNQQGLMTFYSSCHHATFHVVSFFLSKIYFLINHTSSYLISCLFLHPVIWNTIHPVVNKYEKGEKKMVWRKLEYEKKSILKIFFSYSKGLKNSETLQAKILFHYKLKHFNNISIKHIYQIIYFHVYNFEKILQFKKSDLFLEMFLISLWQCFKSIKRWNIFKVCKYKWLCWSVFVLIIGAILNTFAKLRPYYVFHQKLLY